MRKEKKFSEKITRLLSVGAQSRAQSRTLSPGIHPKDRPTSKEGRTDTKTQFDLSQAASMKEPIINLKLK